MSDQVAIFSTAAGITSGLAGTSTPPVSDTLKGPSGGGDMNKRKHPEFEAISRRPSC